MVACQRVLFIKLFFLSSTEASLPNMTIRPNPQSGPFGGEYIDYLTADDFKELPGIVRFKDVHNRSGVALCLNGRDNDAPDAVLLLYQRYTPKGGSNNLWVIDDSKHSIETVA